MKTPHPHDAKTIDLEKVEAQAKHIMDAFLKELGSIEEPKDFGLRREGIDNQTRVSKKEECDPRFRRAFFANAPNVKDDELVMERKQW